MNEWCPESLDPENWDEFRAQGHRMLDDILDYLEHIRERPVWQPIPAKVRGLFNEPLPEASTDLAEVHEMFMRSILPFAVGNAHPDFMGWVHGAGTPVGLLAEMLAAGLNANVGGRNQIPVEVERQVIRWACELFAWPDSASGVLVTGTSMANLLAVLIARTARLGASVRQQGIAASGQKWMSYTAESAHDCIAQAFDLAGFGRNALRKIPTDSHHRMNIEALKLTIAADQASGLTPFLLIATAGSVDVGAIDELDTLAAIAHDAGLWFHVDGAYGALAMLAPELAPRLAGIEKADSIAFDFHKWGQVPYDAGCLLVKEGQQHYDTFASPAAYLRREVRGLAGGSPWPCDFGPDLSRGFRALKVWFTLKTYGTAKLGAMIAGTCALASYLARQVDTHPALELLAPVALNIVCFRYRCDDPNQVNAQIVVALHESGISAPSTTMLQGQLAIRAAIVNHRTRLEDIDALLKATLAFGRSFAAPTIPEGTMNANLQAIDSVEPLTPLIGQSALMRLWLAHRDFTLLAQQLIDRSQRNPKDAHALMDLASIMYLIDRPDVARSLQHCALEIQQVYRLPTAKSAVAIRLLALVVPGDLMANTPLELLLEDSDVALELLYLVPGGAFPAELPEHDVLFVAIGESDENLPLLTTISTALDDWARPVLNHPKHITGLARDSVSTLLADAPGVFIPPSVRIDQAVLQAISLGERPLSESLPDGALPIIVHPVDSHAGHGLVRLDSMAAIADYLASSTASEFFISPYIDYADADGLFRKYRIALIQGQPFICHMAISEHWMIHYLNAGMEHSAAKRAEEAQFMACFDEGFALRHSAALQAIAARFGLDYLAIDCAQSHDGKLLVFEVDTAMVVHALDSVELFPYKKPTMQKLFSAFRQMLLDAVDSNLPTDSLS